MILSNTLSWLASENASSDISPKPYLFLSLIIVLVFAISKISFKPGRLSQSYTHFLYTGIFYILIGILVGPMVLDLLHKRHSTGSASTLDGLTPIILFALGWIGFLFGSNLQWQHLKQFNLPSYLFAFGQAISTMITVAAACLLTFYLMGWWTEGNAIETFTTCSILGIIAANTSTASVFLTSRISRTSPTLSMLQFTCSLDDIPALIGISLLFIAGQTFHPTASLSFLVSLFILNTALGVIFAFILKGFLSLTDDVNIETMMLLAMLFFSAGLTGYLQFSTMYTSMIFGFVFVNISEQKEDIYKILVEREHAIYALLMVLAGAMVRPLLDSFDYFLVLLPVYVLVRALAKYCSCNILARVLQKKVRASPYIGLGLIAQGGLTIPFVIAYKFTYQDIFTSTEMVFVLIVTGVLVNEFISNYSTERLVRSLHKTS